MSDIPTDEVNANQIEDLKRQNEKLARTLSEVKQEVRARILQSQLKVEAVRAGIVDLDCIKLIDLGNVPVEDETIDTTVAQLVRDLKFQKPWLFQSASSSTAGPVPPADVSIQKRVMEMSDIEYRSARAELLRQLSS